MDSVKKVCHNPECPNEDVDPDTLKHCARCQQAFYCCKDCQVSHWKHHKAECKVLSEHARQRAGLLKETERWTLADTNEDDELSLSDDEEDLMNQWAKTMPKRDYRGTTARKRMDQLGMTASFVKEIKVGDWKKVRKRMVQMDAPVNIRNTPPLQEGDYVQVEAGNSVKFEMVGQRGTLMDYFWDEDKWGIDMDNGIPTMIKKGNLRRVERT